MGEHVVATRPTAHSLPPPGAAWSPAGADLQAGPRSPLPSPSRRASFELAARRYRNERCFASLCRFFGIRTLFAPPGMPFFAVCARGRGHRRSSKVAQIHAA